MSYFIVPAVLYQTQQKLKQSKEAKKKKKSSSSSSSSSGSEKKHKHHRLHRSGSVGSGSSVPTTVTPSAGSSESLPTHSSGNRTEVNDGQSLHSSHLTRIKESNDTAESFSLYTLNTDAETLHQELETDEYSVRYPELVSLYPVTRLDNNNNNLKMIQPSYVSNVGIPVFNVLTDLSVLNNEGYERYFYAPAYQGIKFEVYLSIVSDMRSPDPITFAGIRLQNLSNTIDRLAQSEVNQLEASPFTTHSKNEHGSSTGSKEDDQLTPSEDEEEDDDDDYDDELPTTFGSPTKTSHVLPNRTPLNPITRVPSKHSGLGRSDPLSFLGNTGDQILGTRLQAPSIDQQFRVRERDVLKDSEVSRLTLDSEDHDHRIELDRLTFKLLTLKQFIRTYICNLFGDNTFPSEECLMANFINYVRYLLYLPQLDDARMKGLNEIERGHYANRHVFNSFVANTKLRGKLVSSPSNEDGAEHLQSDSAASTNKYDLLLNSQDNVQYLLLSVKKTVSDFLKLETYHFTLLTKFTNNCLSDIRIVNKMFDKFVRFKQFQHQTSKGNIHSLSSSLLGSFNSGGSMVSSSSGAPFSSQVRVLHFNKIFTGQYGWYLALRMPFANIYEHNINHQHQEKINGPYSTYNIEQEQTSKVSFQILDQGSGLLQANFYKKLQEMTHPSYWLSYRMMNNEQFVQLSHESQQRNSNKPANFQYYCGTMSQLGSNSFDLIHSRDLQFQITPANIKTVIREFYRILKPEGVLECPVIQYCSKTDTLQFYGFWDYLGIDLQLGENFIPNYVETLTRELGEVFGPEHVKIGVSPLNTKNELNMYLLKHAALQIFEASGQLLDYCSSNREFSDANGSHVMVYIQATKV